MMSATVYLRLTGKTLVLVGAERRHGLKGRMPRPLLVVHSGKMTMTRLVFCCTYVSRSISFVPAGGSVLGLEKARRTACSKFMGSTCLVFA